MKDPAEQAADEFDRQEHEGAMEDAGDPREDARRRIRQMHAQVVELEQQAIEMQRKVSAEARAYLQTVGVMV